jgi:hypothetical protein
MEKRRVRAKTKQKLRAIRSSQAELEEKVKETLHKQLKEIKTVEQQVEKLKKSSGKLRDAK